jgi:hypothetical protein
MGVGFSTAALVADFSRVAAIAGVTIPAEAIVVEEWPAPHRPPTKLPAGMQAVYAFLHAGRCFKVGKAGPNSAGRYCNHHYGVNRAPSTLAKSLVAAQVGLGLSGLDESNVAAWICRHTDRVNLLLPVGFGVFALSLLEVFVQCRLQPVLEGFASQRQTPNQRA